MIVKTLYSITVASALLLFISCKGEQGDVGPQGPQGERGATGQTGPQGPAGQNAAQPVIYDFTLKFGSGVSVIQTYKVATLGQFDIVLAYITHNRDKVSGVVIRSMLPYEGSILYEDTFISGIKFQAEIGQGSSNIYITSRGNNTNFAPIDLDFRAVVIKGTKGGRLNLERYQDYENLKKDFNLKD